MAGNYMTRKQYQKHTEQIRALEDKISEARLKVGEAAAKGDLSENAEYDAAREEVEFLTTRYQEYQSLTVGMQIVEPRRTDPKRVTIGKSVKLKDTATGEVLVLNIVGGGYTDQEAMEISYRAPLAAGLIGKLAGEDVGVPVPDGVRRVRILSVEFYE
jgi:transcription elongation factor GreA